MRTSTTKALKTVDFSLVKKKDALLRDRNCCKTEFPFDTQETVLLHHFLMFDEGIDSCTDKKENKVFLIYKEIHKRSDAKSYMTYGLHIHI
jgi:hypothetical protein